MCVPTSSEKGARAFADEYISQSKEYDWYKATARNIILMYQREHGWLLDYDPVTLTRKRVEPKAPAKPKRPSVVPGMKVIREAVREAFRTPAPPEVKREKAHAND